MRGLVVLVSRLRAALERLNPTLPPEAIAAAVDELARDRSAMSLEAANREVYLAAESAAREAGNKAAQVRWMLRRASAHRTTDQLSQAKAVVEEAEDVLRPPPKNEASVLEFLDNVNFCDKHTDMKKAEIGYSGSPTRKTKRG